MKMHLVWIKYKSKFIKRIYWILNLKGNKLIKILIKYIYTNDFKQLNIIIIAFINNYS